MNNIVIPKEVEINIIEDIIEDIIKEEKEIKKLYDKYTEKLVNQFKYSNKKATRLSIHTINYLKNINILDLENKNLKINNNFYENYYLKYKKFINYATEQYINDYYSELINKYTNINKNIIFLNEIKTYLKEKQQNKDIKETTIERQAYYLFKLLNIKILKNNQINLIELSEKNKVDKKLKEELYYYIISSFSADELDKEKLQSIKKLILNTNIVDIIVKYNYNNNIKDFIGHLFNIEELLDKPDYYNSMKTSFDKFYKIFKEYVDNKREIIVIVDNDNDGSIAATILSLIKETLKLDNLNTYYSYNVESEVKHGINYEHVNKILKNKNIKKNEKVLIITADNGSSKENLEEVKKIHQEYPNAEFIITDHHKPEFKKEEIPSYMQFINWHFAEKPELLKGYETSGAQIIGLLLKHYIQNDKNITDKISHIELESLLYDIDTLSIFSIIADMVVGYESKFLEKEKREILGQNINKLNAIYTMEKIVKNIENGNIKEGNDLKKFLSLQNIDIKKSNFFVKTIQKIITLSYIFYKLDQAKELDIENLEDLLQKYITLDFNEIQDLIKKENLNYSILYESRILIIKYLAKSSLSIQEDFIFNYLKQSNILDLIKEIEKSLKFLILSEMQNIHKTFESNYSKIIKINKDIGINRKQIMKFNLIPNNGILIILDNEKNNVITGSIRMKDFTFKEIFENDEIENILIEKKDKDIEEKIKQQIKKIIKEINEQLNRLNVNIKIMGHEKGAAGIRIINNSNLTNDEILDLINKKLSDKYELFLKYNKNKKEEILIKTEINSLPIIKKILETLKYPNVTHGNKADIKFIISSKKVPVICPITESKHIELNSAIKKNNKNFLMTTIGLKEPLNMILNPNLDFNKTNLVAELISPNTFFVNNSISNNELRERKNIINFEIKDNNSHLIEYNKSKMKQLLSFDEFINTHQLIYKEEEKIEIKNFIINLLKNNNKKSYVVLDIEGTGFGNNEVPTNIQFLSFKLNNKQDDLNVEILTIFIDPKELLGNDFRISPAIEQLTGINDKFLRKNKTKIKEADEIIYNFLREQGNMFLLGHNIRYDLNGIRTVFEKSYKLIQDDKKVSIIDTIPIGKEFGLGGDEAKIIKYSYKLFNKNSKKIKKIDLGEFYNGLRIDNIEYMIELFKDKNINNVIKDVFEKKSIRLKKDKEEYFIIFVNNNERTFKITIDKPENIYIIDDKNIKNIYNQQKYKNLEELLNKLDENKNFHLIEKQNTTKLSNITGFNKSKRYSVQEIANVYMAELIRNEISKNKDNFIFRKEYKTGIIDIDYIYKKILSKYKHIFYHVEENYIENKTNELYLLVKKELRESIEKWLIKNQKIEKFLESLINEKEVADSFKNYFLSKLINSKIRKLEEKLNNAKNNEEKEKIEKKLIIEKEKLFREKQKTKKYKKEFNEFIKRIYKKELVNKLFLKMISKLEVNEFNKTLLKNISEILIEYHLEENKSKKTNEYINKLAQIILNDFVTDIYLNSNINIFNNITNIKRILKHYNPEIPIERNINNIHLKYPFLSTSYILEVINVERKMFNELKEKNEGIKNLVEKHKIKTILEVFKELHNNVTLHGDTSFESILILKRILSKMENKNEIENILKILILKNYFNIKLNELIKPYTDNINSFSFFQILEQKTNTIDNKEQIERLKDFYKKNKKIPIKIDDKITALIPMDINVKDFKKDLLIKKTKIENIQNILEYYILINRIIKSIDSYGKENKEKLKEHYENLKRKYENFIKNIEDIEFIINNSKNYFKNNSKNYFNRVDVSMELKDIIYKSKTLEEGKKSINKFLETNFQNNFEEIIIKIIDISDINKHVSKLNKNTFTNALIKSKKEEIEIEKELIKTLENIEDILSVENT